MGKRINELTVERVEMMPHTKQEGILYVSSEYQTAIHLCCCGCGNEVVTPFSRGGWILDDEGGLITLHPSIGNRFECRSHYWIRENKVDWC